MAKKFEKITLQKGTNAPKKVGLKTPSESKAIAKEEKKKAIKSRLVTMK